MKLKFIDQPYQSDAVNSICDIFDGCENKESIFTIDMRQKDISLFDNDYSIGHSNKITIDNQRLLENIRNIQLRNDIKMTSSEEFAKYGNNFTIEMETGTGKTYVYTKTILELNKRYGLTKFIIVVPSIAIKEGVNSSLKATNEHFKQKYDNVVYNWFTYDSNHLEKTRDFATSTNIEIMVINIDAFRRSFDDPENDSNKANLIHRESDKLSGYKPIDLISSCKPVVIIDEPQSVDNTDKAKTAIQSLNPLCILRYSATHRELYNLMYRLTPVDAYHENLVKHIEVHSVTSEEASAKAYVKLLSVSNTRGQYKAKVEMYVKNKNTGVNETKRVTAKTRDDLWELSNELDYYENQFHVSNIDCTEGEERIDFSNGYSLKIGEAIGSVDDSIIKRTQIHDTIEAHLNKELHYLKDNIKILSLFFIDEVKNYRDYDEPDEKGKYAKIFEEEYNNLIKLPAYKDLREKYGSKISLEGDEVHSGYFSKDGKGKFINSRGKGDTAADETTYNLIMKDKERLLSFDESIRFIFSHSALKEGWDNPNIFQICTLVDTQDNMTKRQKIGRGLRLCVDQNGERVLDKKINQLTVIANESYSEFAGQLQKELETDNFKFGIVEDIAFTGCAYKQADGKIAELTQEQSKELFKYLVENEYLTKQGKTTNKFFIDEKEGTFALPDIYQGFYKPVVGRIKNLSRTIDITNANEKIPVSINKEVKLSPDFIKLWDMIKQKTKYSVNMDIDNLINTAVSNISSMPRIRKDKVDIKDVSLDINAKGVDASITQVREAGFTYTADEQRFYPDVIRRLQDSTQLLRKTIIKILCDSKRLSEFYDNPEEYIKQVSRIINDVKIDNLSKGIKYEKVDEYYEQDFIFNDEELYANSNKSVEAKKSIFDRVIYDSDIEMQFALDAERDEDVVVYAKLPSSFKVDTPIGPYNPDWAVVINNNGEDKLYFVAETKGSEDVNQLRGKEKGKTDCARVHFEVIDSGIKYRIVKELKTLKGYTD